MTAYLSQTLKANGVAQVIVVLRAAGGSGAMASAAEATRLAAHFAAGSQGGRQALLAASLPRAHPAEPYHLYPNLGVMLGSVDRSGLTALRASPGVTDVVGAPALRPIRPQRIAAAKLSTPRTWGLEKLRAHKLWDRGIRGSGVLVGHLDTGADGSHPALQGAIAHFAEFDLMGRQISPNPRAHDTDQHGTHTAATIAGRPVAGRAVGVAPEALLASAIVIEGGDAVARVLGGMDWAVGLSVRVLSMSLGFPGWWPDFLAVTRILRRKGTLPVFAVGNEYAGSSRSPGNYAEAVSVGACNRQGRVAAFSSSDRFQRSRDAIVPDLVAPGVDVISARPGGGWQTMDGTSMATPHLAGLAALLISAHPKVTLTRLEKAIFGSCVRPASMSQARGNRGIPDALRALEAL